MLASDCSGFSGGISSETWENVGSVRDVSGWRKWRCSYAQREFWDKPCTSCGFQFLSSSPKPSTVPPAQGAHSQGMSVLNSLPFGHVVTTVLYPVGLEPTLLR